MFGTAISNKERFDDLLLGTIFTLSALTMGFYRFVSISLGLDESLIDARIVWQPLAQAVLSGVPLYQVPAIDNKPALFQFLNVGFEYSGHYFLAFLLTVGIANAIIVFGTYRIFAAEGYFAEGVIAALLLLGAIPILRVYFVGARSFAMAGAVMAVYVRNRPIWSGLLVATGALFSQYVAFAALAIWYLTWNENGDIIEYIRKFVGGGLAVIITVYGLVGIVWGWESVINGLWYPTGIPGNYPSEMKNTTLWSAPFTWFSGIAFVFIRQLPILLLAMAHIFRLQFGEYRLQGIDRLWIALLMALSLPLLIRTRSQYFIYIWPWLCGAAGFGTVAIARGKLRLLLDHRA